MLQMAGPLQDQAAGQSYVVTSAQQDAFALAAEGHAALLHASSHDYPGVLRVLGHLQRDIARVTNSLPGVTIAALPPSAGLPTTRAIVLVGTLGRNPWIDSLVRQGRITVQDIAGQRESFLIQVVETPFPGIEKALVIAGSDKRGTIYGMYDLSSKIGVSPWYWWADVPPKKQPELFVLPGRHAQGPPMVKYRGIFINDEAPALSGWTHEKFGGFNVKFYEHVFELILRLRGNFLWPAMWGNAFYDDDPRNPELADEYGIVIGTSHHEPMMRAHDEWRRYGSGSWNYAKNDSALKQFWRTGIQRMGSKESIVTLGMRGDGDEPMSAEADIALLETIVRDQRKILGEVTGKEITGLPQVWALYKEVQEYYDKGMRVPDDVTLLLCDDNWGNIRKLPNPHDSPRAGGYGIYYHYDFVGGPRNYKWVNTNQIARIWEQMRLAYEYGAREIWIVNVGDIKPMEYPIEFFLDYAWNPESWDANRVSDYPRLWAERQFGSARAREIGEILTLYTKYNSRRKPELLSPNTYSLVDYREAETVVREYAALAARARKIYESIPAADRDAFYQLVLHPVEACANLNALHVTVGLNRLYAVQGRASTNALAAKVESLFVKDAAISAYYNKTLAGGKWNHMMDQTHISYTG
ncbi:MAG: glycosyl hydrolase 115 family protein, partial [Bacteroidetes bacterium]|nr:glycosyl hydrolase 115 family protein [Bacteroidota bacterium]